MTRETIDKIESLSDEDKQKLEANIIETYKKEFMDNISYWISVHDLIDAVKLNAPTVFVTANKTIKDLYYKIKKSKLDVCTIDEFLKNNK